MGKKSKSDASVESAKSIDTQTETAVESNDHPRSNKTETSDRLSTDQIYDIFEAARRPVVTASTIARYLSRNQATITEQLSTLIDSGVIDNITVDDDPVVYYPTSLCLSRPPRDCS